AFDSSRHGMGRVGEPVRVSYGLRMGSAVTEFSTLLGRSGPGVMIENTATHPIATAAAIPGFGAEHAARVATLPSLAKALVLVRDSAQGHASADGSIRFDHHPDDIARLRLGMHEAARAYLAAAAADARVPRHCLAP